MNSPDTPSGLPWPNVFVAPPLLSYPMSSIYNRSSIKLKPFSLFPHDTFTSNPGVPPWLLQWGRSWILFPPGGTSDPSVLRPGLQEGLARVFFRRHGFLCIFLDEYQFLFLFLVFWI